MTEHAPPPDDEDDAHLFRQAMRKVTPLAQTQHKPPHKPKQVLQAREQTAHSIELESQFSHFHSEEHESWVDGDTVIQFHRGGLQQTLLNKLRRGQLDLQARVDLHSYQIKQAHPMIDEFIRHCQEKNVRFALIIHGKGNLTAGKKPIIKNFLNHYLRENVNVIAFHSAIPSHGGTGAIYVIIKSRKYSDER